MSRKTCVLAVVWCLVSGNLLAADLRGSIARACKAETAAAAAQQKAGRIMGMRPAYFWVGLGLVADGGITTGYMLATRESCGHVFPYALNGTCVDNWSTSTIVVAGVAPAAAGALVWMLGRNAGGRSASLLPAVVARRNGVALASTITF